MTKRYRMLLGTAVIVAIGAVGGIAAAEQGGSSADHRQNPTTTSGPAADSTTTTTTLAPGAKPQGADDQSDASNRTAALCWASQQGSPQGVEMKNAHGRAFQNLDCPQDAVKPGGDNESDDVADAGNQGDAGDQGQGGPPESPGQSGDHGGGTDNPNAQGHGKP